MALRIVKKIIATATVMMLLLLPAATPVLVHADSLDDACQGLQLANPNATCDSAAGTDGLSTIIRLVINVLSFLVGAAAVIMLIVGGFRYIVSNGDSNGAAAAKNTIMYAIVGLVIVLFAQLIVTFVYSKAKSASGGGTSSGTSQGGSNGGTSNGGTNGGTSGGGASNPNGNGTSGNTSNGGVGN